MDVTTLTTIIGSFGFPIFACIAMGWFVKYQTDQNKQETEKIRVEHAKEMEKVTMAINNNTIALEKLCVKIGGDSK